MDIILDFIILGIFAFFTILYGLAICKLIDENYRLKERVGTKEDIDKLNRKMIQKDFDELKKWRPYKI